MHRNRRHVLGVALAGLFLLALAGCARARPTPEPIVLSFACVEQEQAIFQPLAEAYNRAHPNVTVNVLPRQWDALERMGPADADVFTLPAGLRARQERGDLLSLDAWIAADDAFDKGDFFPGTLEMWVRDGKTWAVPTGVDVALMYYNKDLFDERQVPYPQAGWTWEDFLNTCINLADPALGVYGYAVGTSPEEAFLFVIEHGGNILDDWQNPTRAIFDDPKTIEALTWYADLIYQYNVSPTEEGARRLYGGSQYAVYSGILGGKIGLWTDMYSSQGGRSWPVPWKFRWGMANLPRDEQSATLARVKALAVSSQTKHPEACWRWIDFAGRQVPTGLVPVRRSLADSQAFEQQAGTDAAAVGRSALENVVLLPPDLPEPFTDVGQIWTDAVEEVLSGNATAEEALTAAQQKVGR